MSSDLRLSLGVPLEDFAAVVLALVAGGAGVLLEIFLGEAASAASGPCSYPAADRFAMSSSSAR